jgi:hypothetical protein
MTRKFSSTSVSTTLNAGINSSATSIVVATGTGASLMGGVTLAAGNVDSFGIALDVDTQNEEVVWVTNVSGDTLTVVRAKAGTSAISHTAGATVKHVFTGDDATFFTTGTSTADGAVPKSTVTAKGDLIVGTASGVVARQGVGANDYVLTADSTQTNGIKWAPASGAAGDVTLTGTQTLTNKTLTAPIITLGVNAQTGTTYTVLAADAANLITANNSSAQTYSIPTNATTAFAIGTQINIIQIGTGQVTVQAVTSGTTTILSTGGTAATPKTRARYSAMTLIKAGTDLWYALGDIS